MSEFTGNKTTVYGKSSGSDVPVAVDPSGFQQIHISSSFADPVFVNLGTGSVQVTATVGVVAQGAPTTGSGWVVTASLASPVSVNTGTFPSNITVNTGTMPVVSVLTGTFPAVVAVSQTQLLSLDPAIGQPAIPARVIFPQEHISAFGELQTTSKVSLLPLNFNYNWPGTGINTFFVTATLANGGGIVVSGSMAQLSSSTNPSGSVKMESRGAVRYLAGTGIYASFTSLFTSGVANSVQEVGLGDDNDGIFWMYSGSAFGACVRKGGVDNFTPTGSFSDDKLDGAGRSGYTIDPTKLELFKVEFGWHGSGPCKFYLFDVAAGRWILAHVVSDAVVGPRLLNPTLPFHWKVTNSGNTSNIVLKTASAGVFRESSQGRVDNPIDGLTASSGSLLAATTVEKPALSLQVTSSIGSQANRTRVQVTSLGLADAGGAGTIGMARLVLNPVLTSASFVPYNSGTSVSSFDNTATALSGGSEVYRTVTNGQNSANIDLTAVALILSPGDALTVAYHHESGGNSNLVATLTVKELTSG